MQSIIFSMKPSQAGADDGLICENDSVIINLLRALSVLLSGCLSASETASLSYNGVSFFGGGWKPRIMQVYIFSPINIPIPSDGLCKSNDTFFTSVCCLEVN